MEDAKKKAGQLADLGGVALGAPISIQEVQSSTPPPAQYASAGRATDALFSTPIERGTGSVTVNVVVRWGLGG
jgi:uncharacterized protein YggE